MNSKLEGATVCRWDIIQGLTGIGRNGIEFANEISPNGAADTGNPSECLATLAKKATMKDFVLFFSNAHRFISNESVAQAVWNLRDQFKCSNSALVLLAPSIVLPEELRRDAITITEALPDSAELGEICDSLFKTNELPPPTPQDREQYIDTLLGLSAFEAEQTLALAMSKEGVDREALWSRKVKVIEQTGGLTVYRGKEKFADVGGLENAKRIIGNTVRGKTNISAIVLIDEMDKAVSANQTDTSGTTQDQIKVLLSYIQDNNVLGLLMLGPPGVGKTMLCKSAANEYGIPLVMLDLGAMKCSLVGQSEQNMRAAIKVIHAVSDGRALFVGACNRVEGLPPELRRRFNYAAMFMDLPDSEERKILWQIWIKKYELTEEQCDTIKDDGWTGAEIRNACLKAWAMDCKLSEAAQTIVPVSKSAEELVQGLRRSASGRFISASRPGLFQHNAEVAAVSTPGRKLS